MSFIDVFSRLELKKLVRKYDSGTYLFQQGGQAKTMFILLEGEIDLVGEQDGDEHVIMQMGAGQFLGEKALIKDTSYQRAYGARALTAVTAVEIGLSDIEKIRKTDASGMVDVLCRVFQLSIDRLDKMNHLCKLLRGSDNLQRLVDLIIYFSHVDGKTVEGGSREFAMNLESLHYYIDLDMTTIQKEVSAMVSKGLLKSVGANRFQLSDEEGLRSHVTTNTKKAA
jgi:CRP-like cAMP-binding protein